MSATRHDLVTAENFIGAALIAERHGSIAEMRWRVEKAQELLAMVMASTEVPAPRTIKSTREFAERE